MYMCFVVKNQNPLRGLDIFQYFSQFAYEEMTKFAYEEMTKEKKRMEKNMWSAILLIYFVKPVFFCEYMDLK